jgi:hypothetical protein
MERKRMFYASVYVQINYSMWRIKFEENKNNVIF